jgi:signal transduction histidine kinase
VAHEINNPLAIINEKAGLLKDLIVYSGRYERDEKFLGLVDSVLKSVERCSTITHRLLGFAKHINVQWEKVRVEEVIREVLGFLGKEAEYRNIRILPSTSGATSPRSDQRQGSAAADISEHHQQRLRGSSRRGMIDITVWQEKVW